MFKSSSRNKPALNLMILVAIQIQSRMEYQRKKATHNPMVYQQMKAIPNPMEHPTRKVISIPMETPPQIAIPIPMESPPQKAILIQMIYILQISKLKVLVQENRMMGTLYLIIVYSIQQMISRYQMNARLKHHRIPEAIKSFNCTVCSCSCTLQCVLVISL